MVEEQSISLGRIRFVIEGEYLVLHQSWNPDAILKKDRERIARVLQEIGERMMLDEFEQNGVYRSFPALETADQEAEV